MIFMAYKFLEHTADVKFAVKNETIKGMFADSALALNEIIKRDLDENVKSRIEKSFEINGNDLESLLRGFLEEFLYLLDAEDFLMSEIDENYIEVDEKNFKLNAVIKGDRASNYKFTNDVKAVTYNEMFVKFDKNKWQCQVVLDV